jgi:hypothetical protein
MMSSTREKYSSYSRKSIAGSCSPDTLLNQRIAKFKAPHRLINNLQKWLEEFRISMIGIKEIKLRFRNKLRTKLIRSSRNLGRSEVKEKQASIMISTSSIINTILQ